VGTRESLVCFFITLFFSSPFPSQSDFGKQNLTEKKTPEKPQTKFETFWEWMEGYGTPSCISRQIPRQQNGEYNNHKKEVKKHVENILG
jgi:hypothetical protein